MVTLPHLSGEDNKAIMQQRKILASWVDTPLGCMIAIADQTHLYLLEFVDCRGLQYEIDKLKKITQSVIIPGRTAIHDLIEKELQQYFDGTLQLFRTPCKIWGSPFQQMVWLELQKIPYGQTRSYAQVAIAIAKPSAFRAVAQANGANQLAIIIPCHRVINTNGNIGGYAGGISRKAWLLNHERGCITL